MAVRREIVDCPPSVFVSSPIALSGDDFAARSGDADADAEVSSF